MSSVKKCRFCGATIMVVDGRWQHVVGRLMPYQMCRRPTVATPPETLGEWAARLLKPLR